MKRKKPLEFPLSKAWTIEVLHLQPELFAKLGGELTIFLNANA